MNSPNWPQIGPRLALDCKITKECSVTKWLFNIHSFLLQLSEDIGYVVYSALGSFYIPSCIMVFVYIRIYFAAKARARRGIRKQPRPRAVIPPESPDIRQTSFTQSTPATESKKQAGSAMENVATIENQPVQIPIVTCDFASDVSTSEADPGGGNSIPMEEKDTLKVKALIYFKWCLFFFFCIFFPCHILNHTFYP